MIANEASAFHLQLIFNFKIQTIAQSKQKIFLCVLHSFYFSFYWLQMFWMGIQLEFHLYRPEFVG